MNRRLPLLAASVLVGLLGLTTIAISATSVITKSGLPTFPPSADDGQPLPRPPAAVFTGPPMPTPPVVAPPPDLRRVIPALPVKEDSAGLREYKRARHAVLNGLPPSSSVMARITLRYPMLPEDVLRIIDDENFKAMYFEYEVPGGNEHGGFPAWFLHETIADQPDLEIVHLEGWGLVSQLTSLLQRREIWLIDPGGTRDLYWAAKAAEELDD